MGALGPRLAESVNNLTDSLIESLIDSLILCTHPAWVDVMRDTLQAFQPKAKMHFVHTSEDLQRLDFNLLQKSRLVCLFSQVIVPPHVLQEVAWGCFNFHPGPPARPGWAPLNYAILEGDTHFGTTFHVATERVDEGEILAVDAFEISPDLTYPQLSHLVSESLMRLTTQVGPALFARSKSKPKPQGLWIWGEKRRFKSHLQADTLVKSEDLNVHQMDRLVRAFGMSAEVCQLRVVHDGQIFSYDPLRQFKPHEADLSLHGHLLFKTSP